MSWSGKAHFFQEAALVLISALTGLRGGGGGRRGKALRREGASSPCRTETRSARLEQRVRRGHRQRIFWAKRIDMEKSEPCHENYR